MTTIIDTNISAVKRRACVACTAAKAKCTPHNVNTCQRCSRLGKSCTYLDLPQTKRKRKAAPSRVELLEKKVDQLTSQLAALTRRQNQQPSPDISNPLTHDLSSYQDGNPEDLDSTEITALIDAAKEPSHGLEPPTNSVLQGEPSIVDRGLLSEAEAGHLITVFQLEFVPKFPFVLLPQDETAAHLRDREPFLFLCVVAATMGTAHPLRKIVADEIMKHVTSRIVARSERNLELLRGLLVYSAWYSFPAEKYHPRLLLFIQFCVSILYDLGLQKRSSLTTDEQRALLGTNWLSAGISGTLGRPIMMKQSSRINECIENLASGTESLSDRWIAPFIHLESFLATIDEGYALIQAGHGTALAQVMHQSLQRQFHDVRASVKKNLSSCPSSTRNAIDTGIKYVELHLEALCLREDLWITEPASATRTTMLMNMISRSKDLIRTISKLPAREVGQTTIITSARICTAVGYMPSAVLTLLSLITNSTDSATEAQIQVQAVIDAADYPNLVTELADALETRFADMSTADKEMDIVGSLCSKMRLLARSFPYQVRAFVATVPPSEDARPDTSVIAAGQANEVTLTTTTTTTTLPQVCLSVFGDDMFPVNDIQWDSLLSSFTGFT